MDSRVFIKEATTLITEIKVFHSAYLSPEEELAQGTSLQKKINNLFSGLYNPTLPTAFKLRDAALSAGFSIDPKRLNALAQFEHI